MKRTILPVLVLLLVAGTGGKPVAEAPPGVQSLVSAEMAFGAAALETGMREAFLAYLAPEGIIFRPHPVNGPQWMEGWEGTSGLLSWTPIHAEVSRDGSFGYTTGPWEYRGSAASVSPAQTGYYLSVWSLTDDGWKVLGDIGTVGPLAEPVEAGGITWPEQGGSLPERPEDFDADAELARLLEAEADLSNAVFENGLDAFFDRATEDVRLNRLNDPVLVGREAAREAMSVLLIHPAWEPLGGAVAPSGDLAFTYGRLHPAEYALGRATEAEGSYLRVWRRGADGQWRVAADVMIPDARG